MPLIRRVALRSQGAASIVAAARPVLVQDRFSISPRSSILVLSLAHIGDFVLSLRAMERLRLTFPEAKITLVCGSWNENWARELGWFDEVIPFDFFSAMNKDWKGATWKSYAGISKLPLGRYNLAIDLRHDRDTRPLLYRVDAEFRAGYAAPHEDGLPCLDLSLPSMEDIGGTRTSLHAEKRLEALVDAVIARVGNAERPHPIRALLTEKSPSARPYAVICVGAGDPIRQWPVEKFVELSLLVIERYALDILVVGGGAESELIEKLAQALPPDRVQTAVGVPLKEIVSVVNGAALYVGHGSGITHLAAALEVPAVGILAGVAKVDVWRPSGRNAITVVAEIPCAPCGLRFAKDCSASVACMKILTVDLVMKAVDQVMQTDRRPSSSAAND